MRSLVELRQFAEAAAPTSKVVTLLAGELALVLDAANGFIETLAATDPVRQSHTRYQKVKDKHPNLPLMVNAQHVVQMLSTI